jgi:hypothetical protein
MIAMRGQVRIVLAVILARGPAASGQSGALKTGLDDRKRLVERWTREVAEYAVVAHSQPEAALTLKSEPALRWTNPERETDGGLVFLWLGRGRPEAISCFYRVRFEGRLVEALEFVSLAPVGLTATLRERTVWSPPVPGLEFHPVPGAPRPSTTPAERLRQLRALARKFHVAVDVDTGPTELRALLRPLGRWSQEVIIGTIEVIDDIDGTRRKTCGMIFPHLSIG